MSKKHQGQHKDRREDAKGKELSDSKRENQQLKRQIARLQKNLVKALDIQGEKVEPNDTHEVPAKGVECEGCQSKNLKSVRMPHGLLTVCLDCGKRKKQ